MEMVFTEVMEEDNMHLQRMKKVQGLNLGKCQFLMSGWRVGSTKGCIEVEAEPEQCHNMDSKDGE